MGYLSKAEYNQAAINFAETNGKNLQAQIIEGTWNGTGKITAQTQQIAISFENKSVIIDKITGQIINFYEGTDIRGLINIIKIQ